MMPVMTCPKCGFEQEEAAECIRCGIVIAKYRLPEGDHPHGILLQKPGPRPPLRRAPWHALLRLTLLVSIGLMGVSYLLKDRLPGAEEILAELLDPPVQEPTDRPPFQVDAGGIVYTVIPHYAYELYGMVVSYHDCGAWWDIYHHDQWKDFINIKDLCVIWGQNVETEVYKDMRFTSDSWTCTYYWPDDEVGARFNHTCLSNNHILSHDASVTRSILKTSRGDQIYLRGYLVDYTHGSGAFYRSTSTTRTDTGNGACETIYVEDYQILKTANPLWRFLFRASRYIALATTVVLLVRFFRSPVGT